jgi:predicted nucleic acid-binding protein
MYMMLQHMQVATVNKQGNEILTTANEFGLTFYDSAYLVEAQKNNRVLVTDDVKLAKTAETIGAATKPSNALING